MPTPEHVFKVLQQMSGGHGPVPKPGKLQPAQRQYSRHLDWLKKVPVRLLIEATGKEHHRAKKPTSFKIGTTVYASLGPDGIVRLFPFEMAGTGYELVTDAIEGHHFEFI